jgi:hypothetical protein
MNLPSNKIAIVIVLLWFELRFLFFYLSFFKGQQGAPGFDGPPGIKGLLHLIYSRIKQLKE